MARVIVNVSGPLFDGRAAQAVRHFCEDVREEVAQDGLEIWRRNLATSIKDRTPIYELLPRVEVFAASARVRDDGRIPYGPWLEGNGSRNFPVTRFRGYHSIRRAYLALLPRVGIRAAIVLRRYIGRMN